MNMKSEDNLWTELRTLCEKYTEEEVLETVEVMFNCKAVQLQGEPVYSVEIIRIEIMNNEVIDVQRVK